MNQTIHGSQNLLPTRFLSPFNRSHLPLTGQARLSRNSRKYWILPPLAGL